MLNGGRIDKSKKHEYLFVNRTGTRHYEFSIDADTVEEAKKSALGNFIAKFRAMEPKKNWSKKVLDEPGLKKSESPDRAQDDANCKAVQEIQVQRMLLVCNFSTRRVRDENYNAFCCRVRREHWKETKRCVESKRVA